jgi:hypothetical protein
LTYLSRIGSFFNTKLISVYTFSRAAKIDSFQRFSFFGEKPKPWFGHFALQHKACRGKSESSKILFQKFKVQRNISMNYLKNDQTH